MLVDRNIAARTLCCLIHLICWLPVVCSANVPDIVDCTVKSVDVAYIDQLLEKPARYKTQFTQSNQVKILQSPLLSSGQVFVDVAQGVLWEILTPLQSTLVINDAGVDTGGGVLGSSRLIGKLLRDLIAGRLGQLELNFHTSASIKKPCVEADSWSLVLTPKTVALASRIERFEFHGERWIKHLDIRQTNGNNLSIKFEQPQVLPDLPAEVAHLIDAN